MKKPRKTVPLAERLGIAATINKYRDEHPEQKIPEVMDYLKQKKAIPPWVTESNYWLWRKRLEVADLTRKANKGDVQEFPLVAIPERKKHTKKTTPRGDDDKQLARLLLEAAVLILRK